ncbi:MAG TPA: aromatic ring-hydroxylating dioxygenase subunit alpha [Hyphomicrobiales bacterium]|nr:aromatic ring-hydroxylating dioxygenase subunit alpha [Hyphomicrobiales bacterium]
MLDKATSQPSPDGIAYGRAPQHHNPVWTEVGPGTPCGEFMRRYWHPVAVAEKVTTTPQNVRILGEDLIVFRDGKGRPGLLYPRCMHRGTTLYYGKVEEQGIRCCYHGWLFDVEGHCLDQPCEPNQGEGHREKVRQPWYPVEELYGLIWAYMGPPEKKPVLTRWDNLETVGPDEKYYATGASIGAGGDDLVEIVPCNWLQDWENIMDPFHVPILHTTFSGVQFVPEMGVMPEVTFHYADHGMKYVAYRKLDDGREMDRVTQALFPHVRIVPAIDLSPGAPRSVGWVVPVDDTNFRLFHAMVVPKDYSGRMPRLAGGKRWSERTEQEHRDFPGDWEAQVGQGPISFHSEENLGTSDIGIVRLRRFLQEQIKVVQDGGDPAGVEFDPAKAVVKVQAGNFYRA